MAIWELHTCGGIQRCVEHSWCSAACKILNDMGTPYRLYSPLCFLAALSRSSAVPVLRLAPPPRIGNCTTRTSLPACDSLSLPPLLPSFPARSSVWCDGKTDSNGDKYPRKDCTLRRSREYQRHDRQTTRARQAGRTTPFFAVKQTAEGLCITLKKEQRQDVKYTAVLNKKEELVPDAWPPYKRTNEPAGMRGPRERTQGMIVQGKGTTRETNADRGRKRAC
ncbi:hypothetical protein B0H16DRAFT_1483252 [Mycena metata]|uniref:Uncharacterized protein n=1 Tax=Mycena metata TaxID=1033252 RepID=A0AAD7GMJ6_9AGAR|nr:hypothetical protein B0H16DRAFT_1483252 [Mycena metata]